MKRFVGMAILGLGVCFSQPASAQFGPALVIEAEPRLNPEPTPEDRGRIAARLRGARLRRQLRLGNPGERLEAAQRLRSSGDRTQAVRALEDTLARESNSLVRGAIAESLAYLGSPDSGGVLADAFESSSRAGLDAIARALGTLRTPEAIRALVNGLERADRIRAARAGIAIAGVAAVPLLRRRAGNGPTVPVLAVLGAIGDPSALPELAAASAHSLSSIRAASIRALGNLGDDRGRNIVRIATGDDDASVVNAAWESLAALAGTADGEALDAGLERGVNPELLLRALLRVDPARGVARLVDYASGDDADQALLASTIALDTPRPDLVPVLHGLVREGSRRVEALSALAEAEGGSGLPVLLEYASDPDAQRAIAICLRRWPLGGRIRVAGLDALRALPTRGPSSARNLVLLALARDEGALPLLTERLSDADASTRAWAATGIELIGHGGASEIEEALADEEDIEAFRRLVGAAVVQGVSVPRRAIRRFSGEPHAQAAIFRTYRPGNIRLSDRRRLRRALHDGWEPTLRGALDALVRIRDGAAIPALFAAYDRSEDAGRRRAIAGALVRLGAGVSEAAKQRQRIAYDPLLRAAWNRGGGAGGRRVLRFRVEAEQAPDGVLCLLELPTGQMRLQRTLASGELFIPDLQAGVADVRPILERDL